MSIYFIFGDSITWGAWDRAGGWTQRLRSHVEEQYQNRSGRPLNFVYNMGVNGDTSEELLKRFEFELKQRLIEGEKNIIIFAIGGNDSQILGPERHNRMSIDQYRSNLASLLEQARKYTQKIMFIGLAPVSDEKANPVPWDRNVFYQNQRITLFNVALAEFCEKNDVVFINLLENRELAGMLSDGLHPNSDGHQLIFERVKESLLKNEYLKEHALL